MVPTLWGDSVTGDECRVAQWTFALTPLHSPLGCMYFPQTFQTPGCPVIPYLFDFAASVQDCVTLLSQMTAIHTVCSVLCPILLPAKMIPQVNPTHSSPCYHSVSSIHITL